jgi:hypothetical protein
MILQDKLLINYGVWTGFFTIIGTFCGMKLITSYMQKSGRQSPLVFILMTILAVSTIAVPYFGLMQLKGVDDIWEIGQICG